MINALHGFYPAEKTRRRHARKSAKANSQTARRGWRKWLLGLLLLGLLSVAYQRWATVQWLPIAQVKIDGELRWLDREELQQRVTRYAGAGLLGLNIDYLRRELAAMPWVQDVDIRRILPDTLYIHITEHRPVARWNDTLLLGRDAQVFEPKAGDLRPFAKLPLLRGPEGQQRVLHAAFLDFSERLARLDLQLAELVLTPRHSWRLRLGDGVELWLGNEAPEQRLERFEQVYVTALQSRWAEVARIDLRYSNGLAVAWRQNG